MDNYPKVPELDQKIAKKIKKLEDGFTIQSASELVSETIHSLCVLGFPKRRMDLFNDPDDLLVLFNDFILSINKAQSSFFTHEGLLRPIMISKAQEFLRSEFGVSEETLSEVAGRLDQSPAPSAEHTEPSFNRGLAGGVRDLRSQIHKELKTLNDNFDLDKPKDSIRDAIDQITVIAFPSERHDEIMTNNEIFVLLIDDLLNALTESRNVFLVNTVQGLQPSGAIVPDGSFELRSGVANQIMFSLYHSGFSSKRDLLIEELSGTGAIRRKKHAEAIEASRKELLDKVTGAGADTLETAPKSARRM